MATAALPERLVVDVPGHPGASLRVEVHGPAAAVTVLFSSGLGLPLDLWHPVTALLPELRCVLFDRPGMGGSTPWPRAVGFDDSVELLATVLAAAPPSEASPDRRVVVVGHSHGGLFAEGFARRHPTRVRGLVLVDASDPSHEATRHQLEGWPAALAARAVRRPWVAPLVDDLAATVVVRGGALRGGSDATRAALAAAYGQPAQLAATVAELVAVRDDAIGLEALAATRPLPDVPVELVVARRAGLPTRHVRRAWLRRMTARAAVLGPRTVRHDVDAGHLVMLDDPAAVARSVRTAAA